jgi:hypothetical protein
LRTDPALALAVAFCNGFYVSREAIAFVLSDISLGPRHGRYWSPRYHRVRDALAEFVPYMDACRAALEVTGGEVRASF